MALLFGAAWTLAAADADPISLSDVLKTSSTSSPSPGSKAKKVGKKTSTSSMKSTSEQWNKTAGDAQGRYSVDFDAPKSDAQQTQTSHTSKVTKNYKDDHAEKHRTTMRIRETTSSFFEPGQNANA